MHVDSPSPKSMGNHRGILLLSVIHRPTDAAFVGSMSKHFSMTPWKVAVEAMVYCREFMASSAANTSPSYARTNVSSKF